MSALIRIADSKGRISLPGFANATVILEAVSPNEYPCARPKSFLRMNFISRKKKCP